MSSIEARGVTRTALLRLANSYLTVRMIRPRARLLESQAWPPVGLAAVVLPPGKIPTEFPNSQKRDSPARRIDFFYSHQKVTLFGVNEGCEV
jgi:hypothetical protein